MAVTRFLLMRHAPTAWNQERRIQGQCDTPLSPGGLDLARSWALVLRNHEFQAVLTSDLRRAQETVEAVTNGKELPSMADPRLREQDWGQWTGLLLSDLTANEEFKAQAEQGWNFRPPEGESRRQVLHRALAALEDAGHRWPGQNVLVVTHQGVIKCLLYHAQSHPMLPGNPLLEKGYRLYLLDLEEQGLFLRGAGWPLPEMLETP
ncbi:histidine phosphatase family protein [Desulfocurvibacter africanus]|uniref:Phosphoglycerate mutase n=1 Tax=Desulfocurvibacter africanus subsp. africanus str. Walvis Bay TaxID=690850 RepID=F3Z2M0_DESAF|nr:histidine phosphatase family protein [Desulfocurvibacter africanus]EGJ51353.1 Phosphoglycerate mutase [Desulfocurvibacter africanus subsp. africanus str. Walvis Bay]